VHVSEASQQTVDVKMIPAPKIESSACQSQPTLLHGIEALADFNGSAPGIGELHYGELRCGVVATVPSSFAPDS